MIYCVRVAIQKDEGATLGPTIKKHIIQVSTHQMSILMLFNKRTTLLFQVSARENPLDSYTRMTFGLLGHLCLEIYSVHSKINNYDRI